MHVDLALIKFKIMIIIIISAQKAKKRIEVEFVEAFSSINK